MSEGVSVRPPTSSTQPQAWLPTQQERLKYNQLAAVIAELQPPSETEWLKPSGPPGEPVNAGHRYL